MNAPMKNHDHLRMPAMRKEKTAVRDAAKWHGHDMSAWIIVRLQDGTREHHTACRICGAYARCAPWPAPNGIDVYGTAVALNCPAPAERGSERDKARALGSKKARALARSIPYGSRIHPVGRFELVYSRVRGGWYMDERFYTSSEIDTRHADGFVPATWMDARGTGGGK